MDKLSQQSSQLLLRPKSQKPSKKKKKPMKITYISNPTTVRAANASEFRAIVQELTGKDSRISDTWDPCTASTNTLQVSNNSETTSRLTMDGESKDDIFLNYACSSSLELEDGFSWKDISESQLFEFQSL
ncbi:hypothetical protein P3X46_005404 [Hevea brasiliensis]|uniref:VQ domain-containing protein n=1 Tax=Hevea brasiliensis TaxID=3981 RepID=A0ABQ9N3B2_HEVBR|nr:hypothetical protein P3X46_005404 [Hevea brasiliensis]